MLVKRKNQGVVFVTGLWMVPAIKKMFEDHEYLLTDKPKDADYICIAGGDDIHPQLYKEQPLTSGYVDSPTIPNASQDERECSLFSQWCGEKYFLGICRGSQLLNVLSGGKMWQDVDNHNHGGLHNVTDTITGEYFPVNTLHHQQMIVGSGGELLAFATASNRKRGEKSEWNRKPDDKDEQDAEVIWYESTHSLCFQPHPEFAHLHTRKYFFDVIERYAPPF